MQERKPYLIIGCGTNEEKTYEGLQTTFPARPVSHNILHPSDSFDTLDRDADSKPTFVVDINDYDSISTKFDRNQYQLIVFERFPLDYFSSKTSLSAQHLLAKNGMIVFLPTGDRIRLFDELITQMERANFDKCVVALGVNLIFFFNSNNDKEPLELLRYYIDNVPYVAQLLNPDELMQFLKKEHILKKEHLEHYLWDSAALHKAYLSEFSSIKVGMPAINSMLLRGQKYFLSHDSKNIVTEKKESHSDVISDEQVSLIQKATESQTSLSKSKHGFFYGLYNTCIKPCISAFQSFNKR